MKPVGVLFAEQPRFEQPSRSRPDRPLASAQTLGDRVERESVADVPDDRLPFLLGPGRPVPPVLRPLRRLGDNILVGQMPANISAELEQLPDL